jgi:hypothetical protein
MNQSLSKGKPSSALLSATGRDYPEWFSCSTPGVLRAAATGRSPTGWRPTPTGFSGGPHEAVRRADSMSERTGTDVGAGVGGTAAELRVVVNAALRD